MDDGPAGAVLGADRITTFRGVGREESVEAISDIRISGPGGSWPSLTLLRLMRPLTTHPFAPVRRGSDSGATGTITVYKPVIKTRSTLPGWCVPMPRVAVTRRIAISLA